MQRGGFQRGAGRGSRGRGGGGGGGRFNRGGRSGRGGRGRGGGGGRSSHHDFSKMPEDELGALLFKWSFLEDPWERLLRDPPRGPPSHQRQQSLPIAERNAEEIAVDLSSDDEGAARKEDNPEEIAISDSDDGSAGNPEEISISDSDGGEA